MKHIGKISKVVSIVVVFFLVGLLAVTVQDARNVQLQKSLTNTISVIQESEPQIIDIAITSSDIEEEPEEEYYDPVYYYSSGSVWYENDDADSELSAKEWIAWRESGGDYDARNGQYIGRYQLSEDKLDGDWSPEHQEEVADAYVQDRYGSWEAAKEFWQQNGWY